MKYEVLDKYINKEDYIEGRNYPYYYIRDMGKQIDSGGVIFRYIVFCKKTYNRYEALVKSMNNEITGAYCQCSKFTKTHSCEHIAATIINHYNEIISANAIDMLKGISKKIMSSFDSVETKGIIKKEVGLDIEINKNSSYNTYAITLKIGLDKKYVVRNKLSSFFNVYRNEKGTVEFGKNFTYDIKQHYFNKVDSELIEFFMNNYRSSYIELDVVELKQLLKLLKNKPFTVTGIGEINEIKEENPFNSKINKKDNIYEFDLGIQNDNVYMLTNDCEYIVKDNVLYHLNNKLSDLVYKMLRNNINQLLFEEKDINNFSKRILPIVKDKVEVDSNIDNIVIIKKPTCKLYFDLNYSHIVCNIKLLYGEVEIDYFNKNNKTILRDIEYENEVVTDVIGCGFVINNTKIVLEDNDLIGEFLENRINELSNKYEVFTSEKIKSIDIIKKSGVTSSFSIGKDNIMRFNFDLGDITNDELDNIFKDLKAKKKYFKLKSGNYLNLEDDSIKELESLSNDINLTSKDIKNGSGIIPKYRAIYLDSLKAKYNIIKTDNLFNNFIDKFLKYKELELDITKKDKEVLRDYQQTGVKWLYNICKCDFGGILADEMGLGKSIQIIYLIKKLLKEDKDSKFLIISPTSLVYNWENEFKKFAPTLKYEVFGQNKKLRHEKLENTKSNVYITSYGLLREDFEYYKDINFNLCIIDEAQNIKNPNAGITKTVKEIKANTKFALTGTPIENSALELWSIFDYCMPGFLGGEQEFHKKYSVKEFDEDTNKKLSKLNSIISPFVLRRRKQDVLKELPPKIENNIYIELSDSQKKLYAKEVNRVNKEFDEILSTEGISKARFMILQLLTKLRQLCIDPRIVYENYEGDSNKIDTLINVVKEYIANGHKILLFTSFKTALELVRKEFNNNNITSYTIDGSVSSKKRMELVEKFNSDDTNVFLITLKAGGTGLNLTSADVVIHLDLWWNPQAENQATDRAHRIGQEHTVEVIKLVSNGTIEEKILELQQKKKTLSDKVIEGEDMDKNIISKLTEKELKDLLSYENK